MDDAWQSWYSEREPELVERNLRTAWSYVTANPWNTFTTEFLEQMDRVLDERGFFIKDRRYKNGDLELEDDPLNLENVEPVDDIAELFCDECRELNWRVGVKGEATYCGDCWRTLGLEDQKGLTGFEDVEPGTTYALVGCGSDKNSGELPACEKYSSTYFRKKREAAEELSDEWWILSAKHAIVSPDRVLDDYDRSIEETDVAGLWRRTEAYLSNEVDFDPRDTLWVLVGDRYVSAEDSSGRDLENVLTKLDCTVRYPFRQTSGIGKQNQYLDKIVGRSEFVMPNRLDSSEAGQQTFNDY